MRTRTLSASLCAVAFTFLLAGCSSTTPEEIAETAPVAKQGPKLYVMDCGSIKPMDPALFNLTKEEISGDGSFYTPCYLIRHPNGASLIFDTGQIPDDAYPEGGVGDVEQGVMVGRRSLRSQLEEIGVEPEQIDYLALSHYHADHTANANMFKNSTWIVQRPEKEAMFADSGAKGPQDQSTYSELKDAQTIELNGEDLDVFNDGSVWIKYAPGHTPGSQMLYVNLVNHGPVLLVGDLYHFPEEKTLDRVPTFDWKADVTRQTRKLADIFMKDSGAEMWIAHDNATNDKLKKSPEFYD